MLAKAAASNPCPWSAHASLVARRLDSPESYLLTFELLLDDCPSELLLPGRCNCSTNLYSLSRFYSQLLVLHTDA